METESHDVTTVQPWIEIKIGTNNQIVRFDEFVKEMESLGSVHIRQKWYPAFCSGLEFSLVIKVGTWLYNACLSGIAYDLMKTGVKKLVEYLCKLFAANSEDMELQTLTLDYDETSIHFEGLSAGKLSGLAEFFNELSKHMEWLHQHGVKGIDKISVPVYGEDLEQLEQSDATLKDYDNFGADYFRIWSISYDYGCNQIIYDSQRQMLL